ncbi:MAB_1171c family putative transporter [Plantactinospora sp. CA-290183]|uniref:MAB_1171c family putative transporter n=1 Tax=Plantactinospora sp. CA-290183 TaxID=3240006 RepID=UPI003D8C926F
MTFVKEAGFICLWVATLLLIAPAVRNRQRRVLWVVIALVAAEITLYRPETQAPLYDTVNGHVVFIGVHLVSVVEAVGVLYLLTAMTKRPRYRLLAVASGAMVAATMIAIYVRADPAAPTVDVPPEVPLGYWHLLSIFHTLAHLAALPLCAYAARRAHGAMRISLVALGVGMLLLCIPWALNLGWLLTNNTAWLDPIAPIDAVTGLSFVIAAAPPLLVSLHRRLTYRTAMRRLEPLWHDLVTAVPDVVFSPASTGVAMPGRARFGLYRRVVEIRDALLVLRSYATERALEVAQRHVRASGLTGSQAQAAVMACWLTAATAAKDSGEQPQAQVHNLAGPTGDDLDDEVGHLLQVAELHDSPLVRDYLRELRPVSR